MNEDNEAGNVSPNSAMAQLAAYRMQRMKQSQIEEDEDSDDEPQVPLLGDKQDGDQQQVNEIKATSLINESSDAPPYQPPNFGDKSDHKPLLDSQPQLIDSSLNEESSQDNIDLSFIPVSIPPRMIYDMTRGSKNMNMVMKGELENF